MSEPAVTWTGDEWQFVWPSFQVVITVSRVYDSRREGLSAEVVLETTAKVTDAVVAYDRLTLGSERSRKSLAKVADERLPAPWEVLLKKAALRVRDDLRIGEPMVDIGHLAEEVEREQVVGLLPNGAPAMLYADGGEGKSTTAMLLALHIDQGLSFLGREVIQAKTAFLDWEWDKHHHDRILKDLANGAGFVSVPTLKYKRCSLPLADDLKAIRREVVENGIEYVVIDSGYLAAGSGGDSNGGAEGVIRFYQALRTLNVGSLIVHHESKDGGKNGPMSSRYWTNLARSVWQVKGEQAGRELRCSLFHFKTNSQKQPPFGVTYTFSPGCIAFAASDPKEGAEYLERLNLQDRIARAIMNLKGKANVFEIAKEMGESADKVRATLNRHRDKRFVKVGDDWGNKSDVA